MLTRDRSIIARLKHRQDGTKEMVVPDGFAPWRLGQRVWIRATCGRIEVTPMPLGRRGAGRHSRRIRRGRRSLLKEPVRQDWATARRHWRS